MRNCCQYREALFQGRLWNPSIVRPLLWLDGSDLSTITFTGSGVSEWRDKSGFRQHFSQSTDSQRPTITKAEGLPALLFDGSNDNLTALSTAQTYAYPFTALFLASASSFSNAYNTLFDSYQDSSGTNPGHAYFIESNGKSAFYGVSTTGQQNYDGTGAITYSTGTPFLFACSVGNSLIKSWGNGVVDAAPSSLSFTNTTTPVGSSIYVGAGVRFSRYTPWTLREVLFISGVSARGRQIAEGAMLWKRGLQRLLPASHPFKNRPPLIGD